MKLVLSALEGLSGAPDGAMSTSDKVTNTQRIAYSWMFTQHMFTQQCSYEPQTKNKLKSKKRYWWEQEKKPLRRMQDIIANASPRVCVYWLRQGCALLRPLKPHPSRGPIPLQQARMFPHLQFTGGFLLFISRPLLSSAIDIIEHVLSVSHWGYKGSYHLWSTQYHIHNTIQTFYGHYFSLLLPITLPGKYCYLHFTE